MVSVLAFVCLLASYSAAVEETSIYVHPTRGADTPRCYSPTTAGVDNPCRSLVYAMDEQHLQNNTQVVLLPASEDYQLDGGTLSVANKSDFAITSSDDTFIAVIRCSNQSGFAFTDVKYLLLMNLHVTGCGTLQSSTSKNYTEGATSTMSFLVALYVNKCGSVSMKNVTVEDSEGTGVTMYNSGWGDNGVVITDSVFNENNGDQAPYYGGGFYVEFTYCEPGVVNCTNTLVQNSYSTVQFDNCAFDNNVATAASENASFIVPHYSEHAAFGRGGGLSFFFKGKADKNHISITRCRFVGNSAVWGGGLFVEFDDSSSGNNVAVQSSVFENNRCNYKNENGTGGGGMRVGHYALATSNSISIEDSTFVNNSALFGGGISISPVLTEGYSPLFIPEVVVSNSHFEENTAKLGAALEATVFPMYLNGSVAKVILINDTFVNNRVTYLDSNHYQLGIGAVYLNGVPAIFNSRVNFTGNHGCALAVISAYVDFSTCHAVFRSNRGKHGGAVSLLGSAVIQIGQDTDITFENNHASLYGGAIHNKYIGWENMASYTKCFIKHNDPLIELTSWTSKLAFINNTAGFEGQAIFSSSILPCAWANHFGLRDVANFFCQWKFETKKGSTNCTEQISTLANSMTSRTNWEATVFPGQMMHLEIDVMDDLGHNITNNVVFSAQMTRKEEHDVKVAPPFKYVTNQSIILTGDVQRTVSLDLDTIFARAWHINYTVHLSSCPTGYKLSTVRYNGPTCECYLNDSSYQGLLWCDSDYRIKLYNNHWLGQLEPTGPLYLAKCPVGYCKSAKHGYGFDLPIVVIVSGEVIYDKVICSPTNRKGILCGKCVDNFSVALNTIDFQCINCTGVNIGANVALYLVVNYVPVFVLFLLIILFNIRLTAGPAVSFLLFYQVIAARQGISNDSLTIAAESKLPSFVDLLYKVPFSIFNLKFLFLQLFNHKICFFNMNALDALQLDTLVALSPLLMIGIVIFAVKMKDHYFTRRMAMRMVTCCQGKCFCLTAQGRNIKLSLLHAFAAFILLSYNTFCLSAAMLLSRVGLFNDTGEFYPRSVSTYAGHIYTDTLYYQMRYALSAYLMLLLFVIPPPLILLGFPVRLFERCVVSRSGCIQRFYPADKISILLDTFQGCYRQKTRFFAGLYLLFRLAVFFTSSESLTPLGQHTIQTVLSLVLLVLVSVFQPYQRRFLNWVDTLIFANLTIINVLRTYLLKDLYSEPAVFWICYVLIFLPLVYMIAYLVWALLGTHRDKVLMKCCLCFKRRRPVRMLFDVAGGRSFVPSNGPRDFNSNDDSMEQLFKRAQEKNDYCPSSAEPSLESAAAT